jgi:hypothetical protein
MRIRLLLIVALLTLLTVAMFRNELHAHAIKECGFWGPMSAGISCE